MREFEVPIRSITVEVQTTDGTVARGEMYHTESLYQTGGAQDIVKELLDGRVFVPFRAELPDEQRCLLNKRHVVWIHVPELTAAELHPDEGGDDGAGETCTLLLDDGSELTGRPVVPTPPSASRVADKFNQARLFVAFASDRGIHFVNPLHVVRIVQLS
jgi:hypothetical protein